MAYRAPYLAMVALTLWVSGCDMLSPREQVIARMPPAQRNAIKALEDRGIEVHIQPWSINCRGVDVRSDELVHLEELPNIKVFYGSRTEISTLEHLGHLKRLELLQLSYTQVGNDDLKHLSDLSRLTSLHLSYCPNIGDDGLRHLRSLQNLKTLNLKGTSVTDAGLQELAGMKNLDSLNLSVTSITDAGLRELAAMKHLNSLHICGIDGITDTSPGVLSLREALPHCSILTWRTR